MKNLQKIIFIFFLLLISCKDEANSAFPITDYDTEMELEKVSKEIRKFDDVLEKLYRESEKNPKKVLLKIDSLFKANEIEKDKYKSQIKDNIADDLRYFKAELLYNLGEYEKSIKELKIGTSGDDDIGLVCNYVKLKKFDKAKRVLDSIPDYTFNTFIYANFYETIGKKNEAENIYRTIEKDKSIKHYVYYKLAVNRLGELKKNNSKLLNEIYFPTGNPSFEICDSDNKNRKQIFKLMEELPENQDWAGTSIIESPQENDKNYYWIEVETQQGKKIDYYIYQETFEIKYFDKKNNKLMTLDEWRKSK